MGKASGSKIRRFCPCGRKARSTGRGPDGEQRFGVLCSTCNRANIHDKKNYCEKCGFVAQIPQQIEVDHKDGNRRNNNRDNLWSLCANCHRLKTQDNKEWKNRYE